MDIVIPFDIRPLLDRWTYRVFRPNEAPYTWQWYVAHIPVPTCIATSVFIVREI